MQSGTLRNLAILMVVVALGLGLYAVRLGRELSRPAPAPVSQVADELARVVVALRAVEPGEELTADALSLEAVGVVPEGAFQQIEGLTGRVVNHSLSPGEPVMEKHFRPPGPIAMRLETGERALAVKVDGVIGLGGFIQPGDRVDVVLYVAKDQREVDNTQARVLLQNIRVLAYGDHVDDKPAKKQDGPRSDARTAVLAVPEELVPRLMLGASKGSLRLALRGGNPEEESALVVSAEGVETLRGLLGSQPEATNGSRPARKKRGLAIHRGPAKEIARY